MRLRLHHRGDRGPDVVLIHGVPGSADVWTPVTDQLAHDHRVHVPDLLGFGASARPESAEELWADEQAKALACSLDEAGVERACVVGHDFGGPLALELARQRPELVSALGLFAANTFPDTPIPLPIRAVTWPLVGRPAGAALFSGPSLALMLKQGSSRSLDRNVYLGDAAKTHAIGTIFAYALRNLADLYISAEATLREVEVPVVVGWGDKDPFFGLEQGERTAAAARASRLAVYPGARHFLPSERPDELARDIRTLAAR